MTKDNLVETLKSIKNIAADSLGEWIAVDSLYCPTDIVGYKNIYNELAGLIRHLALEEEQESL